jgi:hypothetical protein
VASSAHAAVRPHVFRALLLLAFLATAGQTAAAAIIDFNDFSHFGAMPIDGDRYQAQGVLLETTGLRLEAAGPAAAPVLYYVRVPDGFGDIIVRFVLPGTSDPGVTDHVSFDVIDSGSPSPAWSASIYDLNDNLLDQQVGASGDSMPVSFDSTVANIHKLVISHPSNGGIDTLAFGDIIPEPAGLVLLAAGGLLLTRRRLRKNWKWRAALRSGRPSMIRSEK